MTAFLLSLLWPDDTWAVDNDQAGGRQTVRVADRTGALRIAAGRHADEPAVALAARLTAPRHEPGRRLPSVRDLPTLGPSFVTSWALCF